MAAEKNASRNEKHSSLSESCSYLFSPLSQRGSRFKGRLEPSFKIIFGNGQRGAEKRNIISPLKILQKIFFGGKNFIEKRQEPIQIYDVLERL